MRIVNYAVIIIVSGVVGSMLTMKAMSVRASAATRQRLVDAANIREVWARAEILRIMPDLANDPEWPVDRLKNVLAEVTPAPRTGEVTRVQLGLEEFEPKIKLQIGNIGLVTLWMAKDDVKNDLHGVVDRPLRVKSITYDADTVLRSQRITVCRLGCDYGLGELQAAVDSLH